MWQNLGEGFRRPPNKEPWILGPLSYQPDLSQLGVERNLVSWNEASSPDLGGCASEGVEFLGRDAHSAKTDASPTGLSLGHASSSHPAHRSEFDFVDHQQLGNASGQDADQERQSRQPNKMDHTVRSATVHQILVPSMGLRQGAPFCRRLGYRGGPSRSYDWAGLRSERGLGHPR